jgi:transposase-like protein
MKLFPKCDHDSYSIIKAVDKSPFYYVTGRCRKCQKVFSVKLNENLSQDRDNIDKAFSWLYYRGK